MSLLFVTAKRLYREHSADTVLAAHNVTSAGIQRLRRTTRQHDESWAWAPSHAISQQLPQATTPHTHSCTRREEDAQGRKRYTSWTFSAFVGDGRQRSQMQ